MTTTRKSDNNQNKKKQAVQAAPAAVADHDDDAASINSDAAIAVPEAHMARPRRKRSIARKLSFGAPSKAALAVLSDASVVDNDEQTYKADIEEALLPTSSTTKKKQQQQQQPPQQQQQRPSGAGGAGAGQQATGKLHQIRRTRTLENQSIKAAIDVNKLQLKRGVKAPVTVGGGGSGAAAAAAAAPLKKKKNQQHNMTTMGKPSPTCSNDLLVARGAVSAAHVAIAESNLDHRDADDDEVANMTDDGFDYGDDDGSDIAVTVPKQQQRDRDNSMTSSLRRTMTLHGTASKAAAAVLASLDDSMSRQEMMCVNDGRDIEALLPHHDDDNEQQQEQRRRRPRRSISGKLERTVEAIMDSSFGRAASAGRSRLTAAVATGGGSAVDGSKDSSGDDELSSLQKKKKKQQQRMKQTQRKSSRSSISKGSGTGFSVAPVPSTATPSEIDSEEGNGNNKRKQLKKEVSYNNNNKRKQKAMSTYTGTSRTGSLSDLDVDDDDDDDGNNNNNNNNKYTDICIDETKSVRSVTSRATLASNRTHRTLKEIRSEKNLPMMNQDVIAANAPKNTRSSSWCCGLSIWTMVIVAITAMIGFGVGFIVPLFRKKLAETPPPQTSSLPPLDPSIVNPFGEYGMEHLNGNHPDGSGPITIQTVPPIDNNGNNNNNPGSTTNIPSSSEQQQQQRPEGEEGGNNPEQESTSIFPIIDVWKLFGTENQVRVPQASVKYLSTNFRQDHLEEAARLFVQGTIQRNIRMPRVALEKKSVAGGLGDEEEEEYVIPFMDTPLQAFDGEMPYPTTASSKSDEKYPQGDVARWEDIMTKLGIQESDTLQWDQERGVLYVARGKHIEIIDTKTGSERAKIKLPTSGTADDKDLSMLRDSWLMDTESDGWKPAPPEPFVEQLLLTTEKEYLVVVVSDYRHVHQAKVKPLLKESQVTQLFTYRLTHTDNITQYELIDDPHPIHGRLLYAAQATSNQHIHVVTSSGIDTTRFLQDPLERLYYPDRHDNVYVDEVLDAARDKYVPLYVRRLLDEIDSLEGELKLLPLTQWITGDGAATEEERQLENLVTAQEHLQELVVVTSFSIVETNDPSATATLRQAASGTTMTSMSTAAVSTAFLGPPSMQVIGSTDTHLAVSVPGYNWSTDAKDGKVLQEATHVMQWELGTLSVAGSSNRAATRFQSIGSIPGRLVQAPRQSTYRTHDDLNLATILTSQWKVGPAGTTQPMEESLVHKSFLHVLHQTTLQHRAGSPVELFKGEPALLSSVTYLDDVAYAFPLHPASVGSANKAGIQVVKLPSNPEDRSDNTLQVSGSISPVPQGFSPHLHKVYSSDSKKLIMSIGQNATDSGLSNKWMLTVWDASDPLHPAALVRRSLEAENTITTWKPKTYRVTPHGLVILPMTVEHLVMDTQAENMKGFLVLHVSATEVKELTDVEILELTRVPHSSVVMSTGECQPGDAGCGLEGKSLFGTAEGGAPLLLTIEGATAKLTTFESEAYMNKKDAHGWTLPLP